MSELNQSVAQHLLESATQLFLVFALLATRLIFLQSIYDKHHHNSGGSAPNG